MSILRIISRYTMVYLCMVMLLPLSLLVLLERYTLRTRMFYDIGAHTLALIPGLPGSCVRAGYYMITLKKFHPTSVIGFGSYISDWKAIIHSRSGMGAYCIIGLAEIKSNTRLASRVSIVSGLNEHGGLEQTQQDVIRRVIIGSNCWLGEGSTIGEDIGDNSIIGIGAVVIKKIPANSVAMGNPARVIRSTEQS